MIHTKSEADSLLDLSGQSMVGSFTGEVLGEKNRILSNGRQGRQEERKRLEAKFHLMLSQANSGVYVDTAPESAN